MEHGITLDSSQARLYDDAVWATREMTNHGVVYTMHSYITFTGEHIKPSSQEDLMGYQKGESFMDDSDTMVHLFDYDTCRKKISLLPGATRMVLHTKARITKTGELLDYDLEYVPFQSLGAMTFEQFHDTVLDKNDAFYTPCVCILHCAQILWKRRMGQCDGSVYFKSAFDNNGVIKPHLENNVIGKTAVHEIMAFTNHLCAKMMKDRNIPMLYSVPQADIGNNTPRYSLSCSPYTGLGFDSYAHLTSPMRRYADVVNHRILSSFLQNKPCLYNTQDLTRITGHLNALLSNQSPMLSSPNIRKNLTLMDTETFSASMRANFDIATKMEFERRCDNGTITPRDIAYALFDKETPFSVPMTSHLLGRLYGTGFTSLVWDSGQDYGLPSLTCSITPDNDGYKADVCVGSHHVTMVGQTHQQAKDLAIMSLLTDVMDIRFKPGKPLNIKTMYDDILQQRCRIIGIEPVSYDIQNTSGFYQATAMITLNNEVYKTPVINSQTKNGVIDAAAKALYDLTHVYIDMLMSEDHKPLANFLLENEERHGAATSLKDACVKYGGITIEYSEEYPDIPHVLCHVSLNSPQGDFRTDGHGSSHHDALENAATNFITLLSTTLDNRYHM